MAKKKVIYELQKETINFETGEIVESTRHVTRKVNKEKFALMYLHDIASVIDLSSKAEFKVLLSIVEKASFNTNRIILVKPIKEEIAQEVGLGYSSVTAAITRLAAKNILLRTDPPVYYLNPKWFFKGEEIERSKILKMTIEYEVVDTGVGLKNPKQ